MRRKKQRCHRCRKRPYEKSHVKQGNPDIEAPHARMSEAFSAMLLAAEVCRFTKKFARRPRLLSRGCRVRAPDKACPFCIDITSHAFMYSLIGIEPCVWRAPLGWGSRSVLLRGTALCWAFCLSNTPYKCNVCNVRNVATLPGEGERWRSGEGVSSWHQDRNIHYRVSHREPHLWPCSNFLKRTAIDSPRP